MLATIYAQRRTDNPLKPQARFTAAASPSTSFIQNTFNRLTLQEKSALFPVSHVSPIPKGIYVNRQGKKSHARNRQSCC